jgi:hypothetical protein
MTDQEKRGDWGDVGNAGDVGTARGGDQAPQQQTDAAWQQQQPGVDGPADPRSPQDLHRLVGECIAGVAELSQRVEMLHGRQLDLQAQLGELQAHSYGTAYRNDSAGGGSPQ